LAPPEAFWSGLLCIAGFLLSPGCGTFNSTEPFLPRPVDTLQREVSKEQVKEWHGLWLEAETLRQKELPLSLRCSADWPPGASQKLAGLRPCGSRLPPSTLLPNFSVLSFVVNKYFLAFALIFFFLNGLG